MSKKSRTSQSRKAPAAPAGLVAAFKMVALDERTPAAAQDTAGRTYPHALKAIDCLNNDGSDVALQKRLDAAARDLYDSWADSDPAETPNMIAFASFYVGFAVCWRLLADVKGGA